MDDLIGPWIETLATELVLKSGHSIGRSSGNQQVIAGVLKTVGDGTSASSVHWFSAGARLTGQRSSQIKIYRFVTDRAMSRLQWYAHSVGHAVQIVGRSAGLISSKLKAGRHKVVVLRIECGRAVIWRVLCAETVRSAAQTAIVKALQRSLKSSVVLKTAGRGSWGWMTRHLSNTNAPFSIEHFVVARVDDEEQRFARVVRIHIYMNMLTGKFSAEAGAGQSACIQVGGAGQQKWIRRVTTTTVDWWRQTKLVKINAYLTNRKLLNHLSSLQSENAQRRIKPSGLHFRVMRGHKIGFIGGHNWLAGALICAQK